MIARVLGNKIKFCRLYEDDVFGNLNSRPKINHRILNTVFGEFYWRDFNYRNKIRNLKFLKYKLNFNYQLLTSTNKSHSYQIKHLLIKSILQINQLQL